MTNTANCPHCGKPISIVRVPVGSGLTHVTAGISHPPAPAPITIPPTQNDGWVQVNQLVKCNRCGDEALAWQKSKNGKFYLARGRKNADGTFSANRKEFHTCH